MASIRYSELVSEIRGAAGGVVFSRNANGAYVRNRVKGVAGNSAAQSAQRAAMSAVSTGWRSLSQAQRQSFITGAPSFPYVNRLGETKQYTGQQLFMALNMALSAIGVAPLENCPVPTDVVSQIPNLASAILLAGSIDELNLTFAGNPNCYGIISASAPQSAGRSRFAAGGMKQIFSGVIDTGDNYSSFYNAVYSGSSANVGDVIFLDLKFVNPNTGQSSATQRLVLSIEE